MFDIIIIGGGPGGYTAAERAGEKGKTVLLVEKNILGGVCLNEGCIPTKTLLNASKYYVHAEESARFGVHISGIRFELSEAMAWKDQVTDTLRKGIAFLMKKNRVEVIKGEAKIVSQNTIEVGGVKYEAGNIIIATGSSTFIPSIPGALNKNVITSTEALQLESLPKSVAIVGGGAIGVEFASFFSSFGVTVHLIEMLDEILPSMDTEIAHSLRKAMKKTNFILSAKVEEIEGNIIRYSQNANTATQEAELILMAVGRRPNLMNLGLDEIGLVADRTGIKVNGQMQTNIPGIYAVGDVTGKIPLAHTANRMAEVAVNTICGVKDQMRYHAIPWVVYGYPECAGCGMTEAEALKTGIKIRTATVQMRVNGRFLAENGFAPGVCKVIVDTEKKILLGVHMMGGSCSEMIYGVAGMIESGMPIDRIKEIIFPHPSVSEIIKEALMNLH